MSDSSFNAPSHTGITASDPNSTLGKSGAGELPNPDVRMQRKLRLWPGLLIIALLWTAVEVPARIWPGTMYHFYGMMMGSMGGALAIILWWLFFSRLGWLDRILGVVVCIAGGVGLMFLGDHTVVGMGMVFGALPAAL